MDTEVKLTYLAHISLLLLPAKCTGLVWCGQYTASLDNRVVYQAVIGRGGEESGLLIGRKHTVSRRMSKTKFKNQFHKNKENQFPRCVILNIYDEKAYMNHFSKQNENIIQRFLGDV